MKHKYSIAKKLEQYAISLHVLKLTRDCQLQNTQDCKELLCSLGCDFNNRVLIDVAFVTRVFKSLYDVRKQSHWIRDQCPLTKWCLRSESIRHN